MLTNDNSGDGLCATASTGQGARPHAPRGLAQRAGSLGAFYSFVTLALGMKFGEHEYKVMGLAPYAPERCAARAEGALREVFDLEARPARALPLAQARASATSSCCAPRSACASTGSPPAPSGSSRTCCCAGPG